MCKHTPMLNRALKEATKSNYKHQLGALIVKGGRLLSTGYNRIGDNSSLIKQKWEGSIHAEQDAIVKLLKQGRAEQLNGSVLFVARMGNKLAKPCPCCLSLIKSVGIKRVVYSDQDGTKEIRL